MINKCKNKIPELGLTQVNQRIYQQVVELEVAILECDQLGVEVIKVEFNDRFAPRIVIAENYVTRQWIKTGRAQCYGMVSRGAIRFDLMQTRIRGVKVIWEVPFSPQRFQKIH